MPSDHTPSLRAILRTVLTVVAVALALYVVYLLRQPLGWLFMAAFIAVALTGPVNKLNRRMPRGLAIAVVYLTLLAVPLTLLSLIIPPLVNEANELVANAPQYAQDVQDFVRENEQLRRLEEDFSITDKLREEAGKLPGRIGDAAGVLRDIGFGLVNSIFALVTILILAAFMLSSGDRWMRGALGLMPPERRERMHRVLHRMAGAVAGYVAGVLMIGTIAGVTSFIVLTILGVDFALPLAAVAGVFSLIPLVGATIAAVLIGVVTLFTNFPTATIVWTIWAIIYQQVENNVIQPQIQKRTVNVEAFVVLVAVLFGSALFGLLGALVAIPIAASIQIALHEWWAWRVDLVGHPSEGAPLLDMPPEGGEPDAGEAPAM